MAVSSRERRSRRKRAIIIVAGAGIMAIAFAAILLLRHGIDGLVHFFTTPTMEAGSGRKYTPASGVRRTIEKLNGDGESRE